MMTQWVVMFRADRAPLSTPIGPRRRPCRIHGFHGTCITAVLAALPAIGHAHPFGDEFAGQRIEVLVDPAGVEVHLIADLPQRLLDTLPGDSAQTLADLPHGLLVSVDGATAPLMLRNSRETVDLVNTSTRLLEVTLRADHTWTGLHDIEVSNGNLSGLPGWYHDSVRLDPSVTLVRSNLVTELRDGTLQILDDAWSRSELRRRIQLTVDATPTPASQLHAAMAPEALPAHHTLERPLHEAWTTPHTRQGALLRLVAAALLGLIAGATVAHERWSGGALAAGLGVAAVATQLAPAALPLLGIAAALVGLARPPAAALAAGPLLALGAHLDQPWAAWTLAVVVVAALIATAAPKGQRVAATLTLAACAAWISL